MSHQIAVYWIHLPTENDPRTEGYIGITKRGIDTRFSEHKRDKSLSEEYVIEVLHTCKTVEQAYVLEELYRPEPGIGMNKMPGGGNQVYPAIPRHKEWREKISSSLSKPKTGAALVAARKNLKKAVVANIGRKDSEETRRKKSTGVKQRYLSNPELWANQDKKKPVIADGVRYVGIQECANAHGVTRQTVGSRLKKDDWDWHYE